MLYKCLFDDLSWGYIMLKQTTLLCLFYYTLIISPVSAQQVAGIDIPDQVALATSGQSLQLNGAGIRTKFIFDIYVGALYLENKATSTAAVLAQTGAKRVTMHILYDEVEKEKLTSGWNDGFENNLSGEQFKALKPRLDQFNGFFHTVKKGDTIQFDYVAGQETQVRINSELKGSIPGADFNEALLKVWLGDEPADGDLKQAMLGGEKG